MKSQRLKGLALGLLELVLTLLLVFGAYFIITELLNVLFPLGISLREAVQYHGAETEVRRRQEKAQAKGASVRPVTATLSFTRNDVKSKRYDSIAWSRANAGMPLYSRDSVQTFDDSTARIRFDRQNTLSIGVNTLVIVKSMEKDEQKSRRRSVVLMVDGDLAGSVHGSRVNPLHLVVSAPTAVAKIGGAAEGRETDFRISKNANNSSTFVVLEGAVEVSAQGKTVRVGKDMGVTVHPGQAPPAAVPLPEPPELESPADRQQIPCRRLTSQVDFAWSAPAGRRFHVEIARDPGFKEMVYDEEQTGGGFSHRYLKKGTYYWRVSGIEDGREGRKSRTGMFEIREYAAPPLLQVAFPEQAVSGESLLLTGSTDPQARLIVSEKAIRVAADGSFSCEVPLKQGMNLITVQAFDAAGNVTYRSHHVQRRLKP